MAFDNLAPTRNVDANTAPWRGSCSKKPWDYLVTAVVPVIDTVEMLEICVSLLRMQTERPYIIVVDTGSTEDNFKRIDSLRSEDLEVHSIKLNGVLHPSDPVCMAMDLAQSLCRTEYMFATHSDCFLMRRDFLKDLVSGCGGDGEGKFPVIGYEMSPRHHDDWRGMVSHTATIYHMRTMDKIGFGWSMRRLASMYDLKSHEPHPERPNWPDTEILGNLILRQNEIPVKLIGGEENFQRNRDQNIDHCRSASLGLLYSPDYRKASAEWVASAMDDARQRIINWRENPQEEDERVP